MHASLSLPRQVFGPGAVSALPAELALLRVTRPLLLSDRGLERAGSVAAVRAAGAEFGAIFLDIPENPTAAGVDGALAAYRDGGCDGVVALGGGSVLDSAKMVAAAVGSGLPDAAALLGRADLITAVAPLVAVPTTVGTGSDSSPVAGLHLTTGSPVVGTRHPRLVPHVAICDPDMARTLPRRLIAATGIDALSHCIEGFFADPPNPTADALALDGAARIVGAIGAALEPAGDEARGSLMAAAFAGGAAIHKGLGPAHAIAVTCADQDVHHGTLIGIALPHTVRLVAAHVPGKAARLAAAIGVADGAELSDALAALVASLGLPATLTDAGYRVGDVDTLVEAIGRSHFNRTTPYVPSAAEYRGIVERITPV